MGFANDDTGDYFTATEIGADLDSSIFKEGDTYTVEEVKVVADGVLAKLKKVSV